MTFKYRIRHIISICMFSLSISLNAQPYTQYENITLPQVNNLFRFSDTETALFTGRLLFSIPLYQISDPDFHILISISYNSEGFKPRKASGYVGYNWFLNAGGCITREINGYPDDGFRGLNTSVPPFQEIGMLTYTRCNKYKAEDVFQYADSIIKNCQSDKGCNCPLYCTDYDIDYQPDYFHFNFCGYQGTFIINNAGEPTIIEGDFVKIDLSGLKDLFYPLKDSIEVPIPDSTSSITLKTLDGYTYVFGGNLSSLGYSIALKDTHNRIKQCSPPINSWNLTKIIAPNGRSILFHYKPFQANNINDNIWIFTEFYDFYHSSDISNNPISNHTACAMTKDCILDSISVSGKYPLSIVFNNQIEANKHYGHPHYSLCTRDYQLCNIQVLYKSRQIRKIDFSYEYKTHYYQNTDNYFDSWRFLMSINISGEGRYQFDYINNYSYPSLYSLNPYYDDVADLWGYWKTDPTQGQLKEVSFPTGGKQLFQYSTHQYSQKLEYHLYENDVVLNLKEENKSIGGCRIAKIQTYNKNNDIIETKEFIYTNGIFYNSLYAIAHLLNEQTVRIPYQKYSLLDTHIGYPKVTEIIRNQDNNQYKNEYLFYKGETQYVASQDNNIHISNFTNNQNSIYQYATFSGLMMFNSKLYKVGLLQTAKHFNSTNQLVKEIEYHYNGLLFNSQHLINNIESTSLGCIDTVSIYSIFGDSPLTKKIYIYPNLLEKKNEFSYSGTQELVVQNNFQYDKKLRIKKHTQINSDGKIHFTKYTYVDDLFEQHYFFKAREPLCLLQMSGRISEPIEIVEGFQEQNQEYIVKATIKLYSLDREPYYPQNNTPKRIHIPPYAYYDSIFSPNPDIIHPDSIQMAGFLYYPSLAKTKELIIYENGITDYNFMHFNNENLSVDNRYKTTITTQYSIDNRLLMKQPFDGVATYYNWDDIYLIKTKTANQTETYTYLPHIGIKTKTDARGITTYYDYDENGKLNEIYQINNGKKEILQHFIYSTVTL